MRQDFAEAVKLFREVAEQGHAYGQNNLGCCYRDGQGVRQDFAQAVNWFRKAAEQGHGRGQTNLGWCCQYGLGAPEDYAEAVKWFRLAAEQGEKYAAERLTFLSSTLSSGELQEGDRRYLQFKAAHLNLCLR